MDPHHKRLVAEIKRVLQFAQFPYAPSSDSKKKAVFVDVQEVDVALIDRLEVANDFLDIRVF